MVTQKTVLILGAGASVHLGYPTGEALIEKCINFKPEEWKEGIMDKHLGEKWVSFIEHLQKQIKESPRNSIDACLPHLSGNLLINATSENMWDLGKGLIYYFIKEQEGETGDRPRSRNNNWYRTLFSQLGEGYKKEITKESKENLKVITFNYDLSFDTFFKEHRLTILHVNGSLEYDYHSNKKVSLFECYRKAEEITTVGEKRPEIIENQRREDKEKTREWIREAERIFFLGFDFHEENLEQMGFKDDPYLNLSGKEILGTCFGMGKMEREEVVERLTTFGLAHTELSDCDCDTFFKQVARLK